ncbi:MAG: hypothetical protein QXK06_00850 [Candidatus Diapherotrites archaeon]
MNSKGILFTAMVFLMILSILALNSTIQENRATEQHFDTPATILRVSELFENINDSVIELKKSAEATKIEKRILPFDYNFGNHSTSTDFGLPLRESDFNTYFDTLNLAEIMLEDKSYATTYAGLDVDINTIKNEEWGGNANTFHFLLEPFCYEFALSKQSAVFAESKSGRCSGFDFSRIKRIDVGVTIYQYDEDYNAILCNGAICPASQPFNPASTQPYFSITIDDSKCGNCNFGALQKTISGHYNPATGETITIFCDKPSCNSSPITISFSQGVSINHAGPTRTEFLVNHLFDANVDSFKLLDFNVSVSTPDKKIVKSNNLEAIN